MDPPPPSLRAFICSISVCFHIEINSIFSLNPSGFPPSIKGGSMSSSSDSEPTPAQALMEVCGILAAFIPDYSAGFALAGRSDLVSIEKTSRERCRLITLA